MTDDTQLLRAVANVMWPYLQRRRWTPHKVKRSISPTGAPRGHSYNRGSIPGPEPTIEIISSEPYLSAIATSEDTRLSVSLAISLTRADCYAALARVSHAAAAEYEEALDDRKIEAPYHFDRRDLYTRNPALPRQASTALLAVANACRLERLTDAQDAAVIEARRAGDPISLNAVLAAIQGAGA